VAEWLKAADCGLGYTKPKFAAHTSNCMMKTRLIRGILNSKADGNPELKSSTFERRDFIPSICIIDEEKVQTTNIYIINGNENYSSKKSVLIRVRWFESIPAHQITGIEPVIFCCNKHIFCEKLLPNIYRNDIINLTKMEGDIYGIFN